MYATPDPDEVSDREVLPPTPTLAGSTSSLDDSLLQSPYITSFIGASAPPLTKRTSHPDPRVNSEGNCRAWWGKRASTDSSNWRASIDLRAYEHVFGDLASRESLGLLENSPSQTDETSSIALAPAPDCKRSVSGAKGSPPPDTNAEELDVQPDTAPGSSCSPLAQWGHTSPARASRRSTPPLPEFNAGLARQIQLTVKTTGILDGELDANSTVSDSLIPRLSVDEFNSPEPLYTHSIDLSPHLNASHTNSSMLAHCDQSSLAPPCVSMTQTQCGRSALREAGIAHGSPKALAPSPPMENVSGHPHNNNFFQRLVRKTFSKSSSAILSTGSRSLPAYSTLPIGNQRSQRSSNEAPSTPKRSRWALLQRFVAKPTSAAKAAGADTTRRSRNQTTLGGMDQTRRHTFMNVNSSSVSFFGDPLARIDPFARSDGIGATVSPINSNLSVPSWNEAFDTEDRDAHITGLPVRQRLNRSWSEDINEMDPSNVAPTTDVACGSLGVRDALITPLPNPPSDAQHTCTSPGTRSLGRNPISKRIGRRYSSSMLNAFS